MLAADVRRLFFIRYDVSERRLETRSIFRIQILVILWNIEGVSDTKITGNQDATN